MSGVVLVRNRQRECRVNTRFLRRIVFYLLHDRLLLTQFHLGVHLVGEPEMVRLNETHLRHAGSTDVVTFDYGSSGKDDVVAGDVFVCIPEAIIQAHKFRATWQAEVARYIVHGTLHLLGYDDQIPLARRKMKSRENRLVKDLAASFRLAKIGQRLSRKPVRQSPVHSRERSSSHRRVES